MRMGIVAVGVQGLCVEYMVRGGSLGCKITGFVGEHPRI